MSIIQAPGALVYSASSNSAIISAKAGKLVSVNIWNTAACQVQLFDSNISATGGKVLATLGNSAAATSPTLAFEPAIPSTYTTGLYLNNSNAVQVTVSYLPIT